ncbi:MAG TPA: alpha/beta fold hydrolase [Planctomycetota bacterium]|nr:alpha/beta fold hydrolase [Planctomycetota bacterium]
MRRLLACLLLLPAARAAADDPLEALLAAADSPGWQARWEAVQGLSRLAGSEEVFKTRAALLRDARPRAREAVAWASVLEPDLGNATVLALALGDPSAPVRRAAARALGHFPDRRAVEALIDALGKETDRRTTLQIVETLRSLTPAPCLLDPDDWREWWNRNKGDPRFAPADAEPKQGEYEGVKLETRTVAPVPGKKGAASRKPPHVLVLPAFGFTTAAFGPYLLPLRERAAISWVRLPGVQELTGRSGFGDDLPEYPVDRLVHALDAFRASLGIERFLVLANGASGWIALRYAVLHPDRCGGLILVDTPLDKQAYADALRRGAAAGDANEKFVARTLLRETSARFDEALLTRLHAIGLAEGFVDPGDLEIAWLFHRARDPQGFATVPDISWSRHKRIDVPALFLSSASSPFSGHADAERIQRLFPRSMVAPIRETRAMPYVEENAKFHEVVAAFLERFGLVQEGS